MRFLAKIFVVFCIFSGVFHCIAEVSKEHKKSAIVIDYTKNKTVLYSKEPDAIRHPASLTKIMTVYLLLDAVQAGKISFNTKFTTSKLASIQMPSKLGLKPGSTIKVSDVIRALLVKSANDVAIVAAEGLSGSVKSFVKLMNKKAKQLGMRSTHFENPSGVPNPKQVSSARDIAILGMSVFSHFPQYWHMFSEKSFKYGSSVHPTHCKILNLYKGADGAKTGYVCASGYNLFTSAVKYNREGKSKRLFVVVIGEESGSIRDKYTAGLIDKYMCDYTIHKKTDNKEPGIYNLVHHTKTMRKSLIDQIMKEDKKPAQKSEKNTERVLQEEEEFKVFPISSNQEYSQNIVIEEEIYIR